MLAMQYPFPMDLVQAQQEWSSTYHKLAERPGRTELRRHLYRLSTAVLFHSYWQEHGRSPAVWMELRNLGQGVRARG